MTINLSDFLISVGPTECSRANNRRPEDGTRYLRALTERANQIERVALHTGKTIVVVRDDWKKLLLSTIDSAGDTITEREALQLLRSIIESDPN